MVSKKSRAEVRAKKHYRLRNHISGTAEKPRLAVFRSNNHMYAQIIDDTVGNTLVSASTLQKEVKAELEKTNNVDAAAYLGKVIAERALVSKKSRAEVRAKKHYRLRNHISGTAEKPRLAVFRSNNHMYAQIIDDTVGNTLVSASTLQKEVKAELEKTNNVDAAAYLGKVIAERALEKGIKTVVFDRGGFIYQGKIAALAEAAREAGLEF